MPHDRTRIAFKVFDDSERTPNPDQYADDVERDEIFLPLDGGLMAGSCRRA